MNTPRDTGISPEASKLFEGLRDYLHDSAEITEQQLFYLSALQIATFCKPDTLASLDAEVTQAIEVNTTLASAAAAMLTRRHRVALTISRDGLQHTVSGLGYSTESTSYVALIGSGAQDPQSPETHVLNPDELRCTPIQQPNGS